MAAILNAEQEHKLRKLAARLRKWTGSYTVKLLLVPARPGIPGEASLAASSWPLFSRLVGMVKRIVPEFKGTLREHGLGWHYLDKTPYYYSSFLILKND